MKSSHSKSYMILQSHDFVRSRHMLNTLYLHLHYTNGHKHGKVVTLREGLPPKNLHNPLHM